MDARSGVRFGERRAMMRRSAPDSVQQTRTAQPLPATATTRRPLRGSEGRQLFPRRFRIDHEEKMFTDTTLNVIMLPLKHHQEDETDE